MLSYPLSWIPVFAVVAVLVAFNAYLALFAFLVMAVLTLALVVALVGLAATKLYALGRGASMWPQKAREARADRTHRGRLPV